MRREFIVRVIGTLLVVYGIYTSMQISIIYHGIEMCKYTKTTKNNLMCIVCHSRVRYVFIGEE